MKFGSDTQKSNFEIIGKDESKKYEMLTQTIRKKLESIEFDYKWIQEINIQKIK